MKYQVKFEATVEKDLRKIGQAAGKRILEKIREKLANDPRLGIPLKGLKREIWRYRIGDYRVLYTFSDKELWVLIIHIAHRKGVYRQSKA